MSIAKNPKDLAEADTVLKTAAFWALTGTALMTIVSITGSFAVKKSSSLFSRIFYIGTTFAGMAAIIYSSYLFHRHSQLVK